MKLIEFDECSNYRGGLQVRHNGEVYWWRVYCDVNDEHWHRITKSLGEALFRHHAFLEKLNDSKEGK